MAAKNFFIPFLLLQLTFLVTADGYRLPTIVSPSHYEVYVTLTDDFFSNSSTAYDGVVVVYFTVSEETTEIKLHSSSSFIDIQSITLNNAELDQATYSVNTTTDILTINSTTTLLVGTQYALKITYASRLSDSDMYGFYKSSYVDGDGVTRYLATTQFQATYARRAFPCWDEPSFKATFTILITYPSGLNALSNMPGTIQTTNSTSGLATIQFDTTPIMSTYLVAFIVSNFTCTRGEDIDSAPYQVCSRREAEDIRDWAVEIGPKVMKKFDEYTQFNYSVSVPKMDQVAIPDFAAGAMENWGLVTYRETGLLWDPLESSNSYKQSIALVIAHEFTHSWFGNLVTCNWWSETFLNEGFARLFQYYTLHEVLPEWELTKQFVPLVLQSVFDTDSYLTSQALQSDASTPSQVSAKFGTITYSKGASIFRMVLNFLGADDFRDGLRHYLNEYQYSTTIPSQLWTVLDGHANNTLIDLPADLNTLMENWVVKSGFPLLTATLSGRNVIITQERFLLSGNDTESKWYVPISFTTSVDANPFETTAPEAWLTPTSDVTIALPENAEWIILNNLATGYYRVNYDNELWDSITTALLANNFSGIPDLNRAQIVNDVFTLAKVDKVSYSRVFSIVEFLRNDVSYFSWYPAFTGFNFVLGRIGQTSVLGTAIVEHVSDLMENLYQSVPITELDDSNHLYTLNQVRTITWACRLGKEDCVSGVRNIFNDYKENAVTPNKNLRSIVYCNALRYSEDPSDWEFLWGKYLSTDIATERATLITALGCTQNTTQLTEYLLKSITLDSGIRIQDAYSVFAAVYGGSAEGIDVAFNFLIQNYEAIYNYYQSMNSLSNLVTGIAALFTNQQQVNRLRNFIETADISDTFREAARQALESALANLAWIDQYKTDLFNYYGIIEGDIIDENESSRPEYRISRNIVPSHYEIHLNVGDDAFSADGSTFIGSSIIHFTVVQNTFEIPLHASSENIVINTITLNNEEIPSSNYSVNSTTDILRINYGAGLDNTRQYILKLDYVGTFGSSLRGFYKSSYVAADGNTRWLLTTQFEPVHARRAFPCLDEPSFKATFQVLITYPSALTATSNTKGTIMQTNSTTNQSTIQFDITPKMSTYLVAFVISDFTCTEGETLDDVPYQVCSREDEEEYRAWAVEVGPKILSSLSRFTGYNYSNALEKMDQFAIPDFAAGAMENWGLVTYRENYLLWNPLTSTNALKHSIFTVIAHEFAHQWFGNLVTCSWWSEIFLNEGFATYFEFFTAHDVFPDWELDKQFVVRVHQPVLNTDAYLTAQALQSQASTPTEISNKFGSISYSKGGSVIRMVEHILGSENYRTGLQNYLSTHQFGNTKPEDLWEILAESVDDSISQLPAPLDIVMENWIQRSGHPVLSVNIVDNNSIVITQQRFLISGEDTTSKWYVPVSYTTSLDVGEFSNTAPKGWLTPTSDLVISWPSNAEWIILNNLDTAFYRVHYEESLWEAIGVALRAENFSGIPDLNRAKVVDDLFDYAKLDIVAYSRTLRVLEFLRNDVSYFPWYAVSTEFNTLFTRIGLYTHIGRALSSHVLDLITAFYNSVPLSVIDEDNQLYTISQTLAVTLACRLGQPDCAQHVLDIFADYRVNQTTPPKNLGSVVYCNGLRHSTDSSDWEFIWNAYTTSDLNRATFLSALGCSKDEDILRDFLSRSIDASSGIRSGDTASAFSAVYGNTEGVEVALQFLLSNYNAIESFLNSTTTLGSIISGLAAQLRTQDQLNQWTAFFQSTEINSNIETIVNQTITTIQTNIAWVENYRDDLYDYFGLEEPTTTTSTTTTTTPATTTTTTAPTTVTTTTAAPSTEGDDGASAISSSLLLTLLLAIFAKFVLTS